VFRLLGSRFSENESKLLDCERFVILNNYVDIFCCFGYVIVLIINI